METQSDFAKAAPQAHEPFFFGNSITPNWGLSNHESNVSLNQWITQNNTPKPDLINDLNAECEKLKEKVNELSKANTKLNDENTMARRELKKLRDKHEVVVESFEKKIIDLYDSTKIYRTECHKAIDEKAKMEDKVTRFKRVYEISHQEHKKLTQQYNNVATCLRDTSAVREAVVKENGLLIKANEELQKKVDELTAKLENIEEGGFEHIGEADRKMASLALSSDDSESFTVVNNAEADEATDNTKEN